MDAEVIVVGAGPVGLLLAGDLRLAGVTVTVVEQRPQPARDVRASTLHAGTMQLLAQRDLLDRLGSPPSESQGHFGGVPLDFSADTLTPELTKYPGLWKVPQPQLERMLSEWTGELGAQIRPGQRLVGLRQEHDHIEVDLDSVSAGSQGRARLRAAFVVGADGVHSMVRTQAGIPFRGTDPTRVILAADLVDAEIRNRRFERTPFGLAVAARRPDGSTRVMVSPDSHPINSACGAPDFTEVQTAWQQVTGEPLPGRPTWLHAFDNASRQAEPFRRGRVVLAGDAAHQFLPSGGQALNLGLADAAELGTILAASVRQASAGLLDAYATGRAAAARRVRAGVLAQTQLLLGGPEVAATRRLFAELVHLPTARRHLATQISGLRVAEPARSPLPG